MTRQNPKLPSFINSRTRVLRLLKKTRAQFARDSALPVWELLSTYRPILYLYSSEADLLP